MIRLLTTITSIPVDVIAFNRDSVLLNSKRKNYKESN